jgi:DNA-binding PadR family transcriptional regulator
MPNDNNTENKLPRLSRKEFAILELLVSKGEMYGLEMVKASEGNLKRGSIYVILSRMSDKGYIESREEPREYPEIGIPRRKYWASGLGERVYQANVKAQEFFNSQLLWEGI